MFTMFPILKKWLMPQQILEEAKPWVVQFSVLIPLQSESVYNGFGYNEAAAIFELFQNEFTEFP